jgi:hypothetical protein
MSAVGVKVKPIYLHELTGAAWQLLWWLILAMNEAGEVHGGWRSRAAKAIKRDRHWVGDCAYQLQDAGLIETMAHQRYVKVLARRMLG